MDAVITGFFCVEMTLKIAAKGFIGRKHAYLRTGWNILDFVVVIVSVLSLLLGDASQLKALRSLRALRALRPLRVVNRFPGLKLVVNAIFSSIPRVKDVALVNGLFFLIFAIVGLQNWSGGLASCNDPDISDYASCVGTFQATGDSCSYLPTAEQADACLLSPDGVAFPRRWESPAAHFNDVGSALLTVFEVATGEMWPDIMYNTVDSVGVHKQPQRDHNQASALYFVMINVVCAFFMLEIFTGVIIDTFNDLKREQSGSALLTADQQKWLDSMKRMLKVGPERRMRSPKAGWRVKLFRLVESQRFDHSITTLIILNIVMMATRHYNQTEEFSQTLVLGNYVFSALYAAEAVLKITAYGFPEYWSSSWNRFDFILVVFSGVGIWFNVGQFATMMRMLRVARIFRIMRQRKGLMRLIRTLFLALPSLANVGAVLALIFFIYSIVGMNVLSSIRHGEFLNEDANFESFPKAVETLFRVMTGESYNGIMHDCRVQAPYCDPDTNCGYRTFSPIYFVSFFLLTAYVLLNLLVALILDVFGEMEEVSSPDTFMMNDEWLAHFRDHWAKYDPRATRYISVHQFMELLAGLNYPLGLNGAPTVPAGSNMKAAVRRLVYRLDVAETDGRVYFADVLQRLAERAGGDMARSLPRTALTEDFEKQRSRVLGKVSVQGNLAQSTAAQVAVALIKGYRVRRLLSAMHRRVERNALSRAVEGEGHHLWKGEAQRKVLRRVGMDETDLARRERVPMVQRGVEGEGGEGGDVLEGDGSASARTAGTGTSVAPPPAPPVVAKPVAAPASSASEPIT
jgi:hypothetical protein